MKLILKLISRTAVFATMSMMLTPIGACGAKEEKAPPTASAPSSEPGGQPGGASKASKDNLPRELSLDLGGGVKMEFVLIRPGKFLMGSEKGGHDEKPVHQVTITKPFYIGRYEVTQEQWQAVMGSNPSHFKDPKNPVDSVSWEDCQSFVSKLGDRAKGRHFRLPTEAEWEYACRAGSTTAYCFGDSDAELGDYAWWWDHAERKTHPAGQKKPNAWGLYDMHGNVWEWCQDWYGNYMASPQTDPNGPGSGQYRVLRGGSWAVSAPVCRSALRQVGTPGVRRVGPYGVRVAAGTE